MIFTTDFSNDLAVLAKFESSLRSCRQILDELSQSKSKPNPILALLIAFFSRQHFLLYEQRQVLRNAKTLVGLKLMDDELELSLKFLKKLKDYLAASSKSSRSSEASDADAIADSVANSIILCLGSPSVSDAKNQKLFFDSALLQKLLVILIAGIAKGTILETRFETLLRIAVATKDVVALTALLKNRPRISALEPSIPSDLWDAATKLAGSGFSDR